MYTLDWLQSFLFYINFSLSLHYFLSWSSLIQLQVTYGCQGTEVNKNSTSYTSVVSPQKKKEEKEKKNKERVWGQTMYTPMNPIFAI